MHSPNSNNLSHEDSSLPEDAQNFLHENGESSLPVLILISHSHSPPLTPTPGLKFDVRTLPNPPKHVRDKYDGTAKRLQEWLDGDVRFGERRDEIRLAIEKEMGNLLSGWETRNVLKLAPDEISDAEDQGREMKPDSDGEQDLNGLEDTGDELSSENGDDDSLTSPDEPELRVGIFCAMGRHRSVAMVEMLAKMPWPGWTIKVEHRDVGKKRGQKSGGWDKKSRGNRGGSAAFDADGSE